METTFSVLDWLVLTLYFLGVIGIGLSFKDRNGTSEEFTTANRSLPGWLCGLSIFATFLSSISYLALPGKSYADNWNPFVFSLSLPVAAWVAVRFFVPLYRSSQEVSAYSLLEKRFGAWARLYASAFYLIYQIARIGVVMYLMALPMAVIFGWDIRWIILFTGVVVTGYAFAGGIVAVIWADAIQAVVLLLGAGLAVVWILFGMPEGPGQVFQIAVDADKFSLGSTEVFSVSKSTVWVLFAYGIFENLKNFGVDQSYIQRYLAARSDREAARGLWLSAGLYVPVSALFFFIGTALFAWYETYPKDLDQVRRVVARQRLMQQGILTEPTKVDLDAKEPEGSASPSAPVASSDEQQLSELASSLTPQDLGDRVFPHFIAVHLPNGVSGLLIAAVFAAAMSTVSTSLNSSATLVMSDYYTRWIRPDGSEKQKLRVLHGATVLWGILGTAMAMLLVKVTDSILDVWWMLSGVLGSSVLGLFLLGWLCRRAGGRIAMISVVLGGAVVTWMVLSNAGLWNESWGVSKSPFHGLLAIVIGTIVMVGVGFLLSFVTVFTTRQEDA